MYNFRSFMLILIWTNSGMCVSGPSLRMEAESMDNVRHSNIRFRSGASNGKSVAMSSGEAISVDICLMTATNVSVDSLAYSNDGGTDIIEVAVDSNISIWIFESKAVMGSGGGWNQFLTRRSNMAPTFMPEGRHRLTVQVLSADAYGVEIDYIEVHADSIQSVDTLKCSVFCFDDIKYVDSTSDPTVPGVSARAVQKSEPTRCAEKDNINVPVFRDNVSKYVVSASMPKYQTFLNSRNADWLNCEMFGAVWVFPNVHVGHEMIGYRNGPAIMNITTSQGFLLQNTKYTLDVEFTMKGLSTGWVDSETGAVLQLNGTRCSEHVRIEMQYYGRRKTWSQWQYQDCNAINSNISFKIPDFSFSEGGGNRIKLNFLLSNPSSDISIETFQMVKRPLIEDKSRTIFNDGTTIIEAVDIDMWWRINETMSITVKQAESKTFNGVDYLRIYEQVPWSSGTYSQVFVLYQDGNVRLLPLTPHGLDWIPFGSSVLLGQTDPTVVRPCAPIAHIEIDPRHMHMEIFYYDGGHTSLQLKTTLHETQLLIDSSYTRDTSRFPFFTFRSMWISDGNADVDHVTVDGTNTQPILGHWDSLHGNFFAFYRKCISKHNTLSPDIQLKIIA